MSLIDEILRALRDPEYRAQLTNEARGALPDGPAVAVEPFESDQESEGDEPCRVCHSVCQTPDQPHSRRAS